jgi:hypothetical protein
MSKKDRLAEHFVEEDLAEIEKDMEEEAPEKEKPRKSDNTLLLVAVGIIVIVFSAIFVLIIINKDQPKEYPTYTYNGFKFVQIASQWHTEWQKNDTIYTIHLRHDPKSVEQIPIEYINGSTFQIGNPTYVTFDPLSEQLNYIALASSELVLSLSNTFRITVIPACTHNESYPCDSLLAVTCESTNSTVIYFKYTPNDSGAVFKNNCLTIYGDKEDLMKATDKVIYRLYQIM